MGRARTAHYAWLAAALALLVPGVAYAVDGTVKVVEDEDGDGVKDVLEADASVSEEGEVERKAWGVAASTRFAVGVGSFIPEEEGGRTRVRWTMGFSANYTIPVIDVTVSAGTGFSQWLSRGGGSQEPQEFRWSDTSLFLSRSIYTIPVVDISISGSLGFTIPTSVFARQSDLYTTISPGLSLGWRLGGLGLNYSVNYSHNFHEFTSTTYDPSEVDILSRDAGNEVLGPDVIAGPGVLTEMSLANSFGVSYSFLDSFGISLAFSFFDAWSYDNGSITEDDEFVAEIADVGRFHSQGTSGRIGLSYSPLPFLSMDLALTNSGPWKTADNAGFRFPFYNFESPQSNSTYLSFGLNGRY